jgi:hypothetical protein
VTVVDSSALAIQMAETPTASTSVLRGLYFWA